MPNRRTSRRPARTALALFTALAAWSCSGFLAAREVQADQAESTPATGSEPLAPTGRRPFPTRGASAPGPGARRVPGRPEATGSGGWWLGTAGIALALAVCGWASAAAKRGLPRGGVSAAGLGLRVVGRTSLSPRHTVYLLRAGDRVLIVGTGPQGSPSLLGELDADPAEAGAGPDPLEGRGPTRPRLDLRLEAGP